MRIRLIIVGHREAGASTRVHAEISVPPRSWSSRRCRRGVDQDRRFSTITHDERAILCSDGPGFLFRGLGEESYIPHLGRANVVIADP